MILAELYAVTEAADEAVAAGEKAAELDARSAYPLGLLGCVCGVVGRGDKARALLAELDDIESRAYVPAVARAWIYGGLGEHDDAFRFLNKAIDEGSPMVADSVVSPLAEGVRSDPRYKMVLKRMNLARERYSKEGENRRRRPALSYSGGLPQQSWSSRSTKCPWWSRRGTTAAHGTWPGERRYRLRRGAAG
jgi:tetratricopeptide (TPR) repeat protein